MTIVAAVLSFVLLAPVHVHAQFGVGPQAPARAPREVAPIDLTGYWVSVVSEDWRVRMLMAQKGDWEFMPLNAEGRQRAEDADPVHEEPCMAYGGAGIMRVPGRLNITWEDDQTLRIDTDAGMQTRLFHLDPAFLPAGEPTRQGYSVAVWEGGELRAVTTGMTPGYYFKHGVPYSGNAVMTEYFARTSESNGDEYLFVTAVVDDPQYLRQQFVKTLLFKQESDDSRWKPAPCSVP